MKMLRIIFAFLALSLSAYPGLSQEAKVIQPAKPLVSIIVAGPKEPIKNAKEIRLKITFTNISDRDISFLKSPGDGDLPLRGRIEVHDERGKDVSLVRSGETAEIPEMGSKVLHTLKPGDAFTYEIDVAKSYDMSKTGTYTVQFHHFVGNEEVLSNPLVLSVGN